MNSPSYGPPPPMPIKLGNGPGKALASVKDIVTVCTFYAVLSILIVYCFIGLWPRPTPGGVKRTPSTQIQSHATNLPTSNASPAGGTPPLGTSPPPSKIGLVAEQEETIYLDPQQGSLFGFQFMLYNDVRLFILVLLAGAFGACVH